MPGVDPITRDIVKNALATAADEMSLTVYRTARSTIVRDCLERIGRLADPRVTAAGALDPVDYRTTVRVAVTGGRAGHRRRHGAQ